MSVRQRVPEQLVGPLGFISLAVGVVGLVVGYIITIVGITTYWNLNGLELANSEALIIAAVGVACLAVAYVGDRGLMTFAT